MASLPLVTLILLPLASAWTYTSGNGFGETPAAANSSGVDTILAAFNKPNLTTSVPFTLSGQNFTLSLDIADFVPTGADTTVADPRAVDTSYRLSWSGAADLNETVSAAEHTSPPRLCATLIGGRFPASVEAAYEASDDGDCSRALGDACTTALANEAFAAGVSCVGGSAFQVPQACKSIWPGSYFSSSILGNASHSSPYRFAYYAGDIKADVSDEYNTQTGSLHVVIFSGTQSRPVCVRPSALADQTPDGAGHRRGISAAVVVAAFAVPVVLGMW